MAACSTLPLWHVLSLLGVVTIVCGATGGLASYLLMGPMPRTTHHTLPNDPQEPGKETRRHPLHEHPLMGHVLLGITAALVVPGLAPKARAGRGAERASVGRQGRSAGGTRSAARISSSARFAFPSTSSFLKRSTANPCDFSHAP